MNIFVFSMQLFHPKTFIPNPKFYLCRGRVRILAAPLKWFSYEKRYMQSSSVRFLKIHTWQFCKLPKKTLHLDIKTGLHVLPTRLGMRDNPT